MRCANQLSRRIVDAIGGALYDRIAIDSNADDTTTAIRFLCVARQVRCKKHLRHQYQTSQKYRLALLVARAWLHNPDT
jgi:hypothetical protein